MTTTEDMFSTDFDTTLSTFGTVLTASSITFVNLFSTSSVPAPG